MSMWDPAGYDGNDRDRGSEDSRRSADPYADGTWGQDPYASRSHGDDPYEPGSADPYASGDAAPYGGAASDDGFGSFSASSGPPGAAGHGSVGPTYGAGPAWPAAAPGYAPPPPTSAMALTGFIVGLASLVLCTGLTAPVGLVFSILGMRETGPTAEPVRAGRGFAIAGLVISILGTLLLALFVAYIVLIIGFGIYAGSTS
ncbi:hypothetical protein BH708_09420 [Brachybacterium sp. P6-10-X1]|uniref:DUF4190 domain-containing protein n=1 Tax=Brachybacterium sp. P6-10-X1 TaxID=1903186 RepID=UPI000971B6D2|nr:DUF4190 domain-containing protein [Brachybacterium sp. P6-10-X1]APX32898.1 hypothetical protein BH708_09420 [Brachybacterium sp. P6-10-X1]